MRRNLELTNGLIFSGQLLLELAGAGMTREDAYRLVQRHAMDAWTNDRNFRELVESDPEIAATLSKAQIAHAFELERQLKNVDAIFARTLAEDGKDA
jgi:adenylosuccinate lyase